MEITLRFCSMFLLLCHNYIITAFLQQHIFSDIKTTLFFVTFKSRIKFTLELRCLLVCHCEILCIILQPHFSRLLKHVLLITLKIRRLLVRSNYEWKNDITTLRVRSSFLGNFFGVRLHKVVK